MPADRPLSPLDLDTELPGWLSRRIGSLRTVTPGIVDAGCSSLATFSVGLYAVRELDPTQLGAYALVFSAYMLATVLPKQSLFVPAEVFAVERPLAERLLVLRDSVRYVLPLSFISAAAVWLWVFVAPADIDPASVLPLTVTGMAITFFVPILEHVRTMLHIARQSWKAASLSVTYLLASASGILVLSSLGLSRTWIPFGALALGAFVSLLVGTAVVWTGVRAERAQHRPGWRDLVRFGGWLLLTGVLPRSAAFVAAALVSHLASAQALGYAEAARVAGSPVVVLGTGLTIVLGPRLMEAAQERDAERARRAAWSFAGLGVTASLVYLLIVGVEWPGNPLLSILPRAFDIPWLVAVTIATNLLILFVLPLNQQFLGARRRVDMLRIEGAGSIAQVGVAASASQIGAFAVPVGIAGSCLVRIWGYRHAQGDLFDSAAEPGPGAKR